MVKVWKPVLGYRGIYNVSNFGEIESLTREVKTCHNAKRMQYGRMLSQNIGNHGYKMVSLTKDGKTKGRTVHSIVAEAFLGDRGNAIVNHIDGNKLNNALINIEYCTHRENITHARASKVTGIQKTKNRWQAHVKIGNKRITKSGFKTKKEAHEAYLKILEENGLSNKYAQYKEQ